MEHAQPVLEKTAENLPLGAAADGKPLFYGLTKDALKKRIIEIGLKPFRAKQLWNWVYVRGIKSFEEMNNIAKVDRTILAEHFSLDRPELTKDLKSFDDTRKWLLKFADGNEVETVFIPDSPRGTLCVSSQVGCTLACTFCHTGTQRLVRNLSTADIVAQALIAKDGLQEWPAEGAPAQERTLTNIVFMGMGEPLYNFESVRDAVEILNDRDGLALSKRKITVSTSGVVPQMIRMSDEIGCNLALSLHAVRDDLRDEIVPINRKYKLKEVIDACHYHIEKHPSRRIMIEYVMLQEVNDSLDDARELVRILEGLPVKVNLIPFNPWPGSPYTCSSNNRIHAFGRMVQEAGIPCPIRSTRGDDILAACGQLKSESELKKGQRVKLN